MVDMVSLNTFRAASLYDSLEYNSRLYSRGAVKCVLKKVLNDEFEHVSNGVTMSLLESTT